MKTPKEKAALVLEVIRGSAAFKIIDNDSQLIDIRLAYLRMICNWKFSMRPEHAWMRLDKRNYSNTAVYIPAHKCFLTICDPSDGNEVQNCPAGSAKVDTAPTIEPYPYLNTGPGKISSGRWFDFEK